MKRRLVSVVLVVAIVLSLCMPTFAAIQMVTVSPSLTFTGTTANCSAAITANGYISATLELYCDGSPVDSWYASGYYYVNPGGSTTVAHGKTYTLQVSGTAEGVALNPTPVTKTCP